jgi:hypothetical protein
MRKLAISHRGAEATEPDEKRKGFGLLDPNLFFSSDLCVLSAPV